VSYELHGKHYRIRVTINGQREIVMTRATTAAEAKTLHARYVAARATMTREQAVAALYPRDPARLTIAGFEAEFLANREHHAGRHGQAVKPSTMRFYRLHLRALRESKSLGRLSLSQIDQASVTRFIDERLPHGIVAVNRDIQVLRTLLNVAVDLGKIPAAPRLHGKAGERQHNAARKAFVLSKSQARAYVEACDPLLRDVVDLMLATALRPNEVARLKFQDINLRACEGRIVESKSVAGRRPFGFDKALKPMLARRMSGKSGEGYVFDIPGKLIESKVQYLSDLHAEARKRAKLPAIFRLYSLRHTFATLAARSGVSAFMLQALMGWSDPTMAQHYVDLAREDKVAAMRAVPKLLKPKTVPQKISLVMPSPK
jgi:integrase